MVGNVGCIVYIAALLVGFLGGSVLKLDIAEVLGEKEVTKGFGFKVLLRGSLCVSGPCTLHIYCGTRYKGA